MVTILPTLTSCPIFENSHPPLSSAPCVLELLWLGHFMCAGLQRLLLGSSLLASDGWLHMCLFGWPGPWHWVPGQVLVSRWIL
jgi:hypothetical protein